MFVLELDRFLATCIYMCTIWMYSDGAVLLGQELFLCEEKALCDLCASLVFL